jgi:hypothetical protein
MADERKPWDQMEGESDAAYARFMFYVMLGMQRSVTEAFRKWMEEKEKTKEEGQEQESKARKGTKRHDGAAGQWKRDSADFSWDRRASAWDKDQFVRFGAHGARRYFETWVDGIEACSRFAKNHDPASFPEYVETMNAAGDRIPNEVLESWLVPDPPDDGEEAGEDEPLPEVPEAPADVHPEDFEAEADSSTEGGF